MYVIQKRSNIDFLAEYQDYRNTVDFENWCMYFSIYHSIPSDPTDKNSLCERILQIHRNRRNDMEKMINEMLENDFSPVVIANRVEHEYKKIAYDYFISMIDYNRERFQNNDIKANIYEWNVRPF